MDGVNGDGGAGVDIRSLIERYGEEDERRWEALSGWLEECYGREITLEAVLFLIGIQARGRGFEPDIERDRKQDVIMEGTFSAFASLGMYERVGMEQDGSWIWERVAEPVPDLPVEEQEKVLKSAVIKYFQDELGPEFPGHPALER